MSNAVQKTENEIREEKTNSILEGIEAWTAFYR